MPPQPELHLGVSERPCLFASSQSLRTIFWQRNERSSVSSNEISCVWAAAIFPKREAEPQGVTWSAPGGEGCWVISSKIAEFWYYTSIPCLMYIIIKYKKYSEYLKLAEATAPWWGRSVVWHTSCEFEPLPHRWHHCVLNKYGGSRPRGQSLLRYQPVCLWYHYTAWITKWWVGGTPNLWALCRIYLTIACLTHDHASRFWKSILERKFPVKWSPRGGGGRNAG